MGSNVHFKVCIKSPFYKIESLQHKCRSGFTSKAIFRITFPRAPSVKNERQWIDLSYHCFKDKELLSKYFTNYTDNFSHCWLSE